MNCYFLIHSVELSELAVLDMLFYFFFFFFFFLINNKKEAKTVIACSSEVDWQLGLDAVQIQFIHTKQ